MIIMTKSIDLQYPYLPLPKKKANCFFVVACILYVVYALVLLPLSEYVGSNIIFEGTFLYEILSFLCTAVELTAFCWVFSCLITSRFAYGAAASVKILLIYASALLMRYVLTLLVSWKMEGMSGSDLLFELIFMLIYILLDMTQAAIVLMLVHMLRKKQDDVYLVRAKALRALGEPAPDPLATEREDKNIFTMSGALHIATILAATVIAFVRIAGRLIYDIGYGAPADGIDLAWMIFSYLSDVALAVLCCALIRILCVRILFHKQH
jgi:hypothetical protein